MAWSGQSTRKAELPSTAPSAPSLDCPRHSVGAFPGFVPVSLQLWSL